MCNTSEDVQRYVDIINDIDSNWLIEHGQLQIICRSGLYALTFARIEGNFTFSLRCDLTCGTEFEYELLWIKVSRSFE